MLVLALGVFLQSGCNQANTGSVVIHSPSTASGVVSGSPSPRSFPLKSGANTIRNIKQGSFVSRVQHYPEMLRIETKADVSPGDILWPPIGGFWVDIVFGDTLSDFGSGDFHVGLPNAPRLRGDSMSASVLLPEVYENTNVVPALRFSMEGDGLLAASAGELTLVPSQVSGVVFEPWIIGPDQMTTTYLNTTSTDEIVQIEYAQSPDGIAWLPGNTSSATLQPGESIRLNGLADRRLVRATSVSLTRISDEDPFQMGRVWHAIPSGHFPSVEQVYTSSDLPYGLHPEWDPTQMALKIASSGAGGVCGREYVEMQARVAIRNEAGRYSWDLSGPLPTDGVFNFPTLEEADNAYINRLNSEEHQRQLVKVSLYTTPSGPFVRAVPDTHSVSECSIVAIQRRPATP